ncbi:MAG: hypothetical protein IT273_10685 [Chitinophagales bacterium]|nr:hypothetical protein [Chitinophagales bacterium]
MAYVTEQEQFWAGNFGNDYINRNQSQAYLASNLNFFSKALAQVGKPDSLVELGANVGMNLRAIQLLFPNIDLFGVEINQQAAQTLAKAIGTDKVFNGSIFDFVPPQTFDVALIKGVLIHINPDMLPLVYKKLYDASKRYILVCEYYNPSPVMVSYRGHQNKLFKRDFAGELLDQYPDLQLRDYGFVYRREKAFPQDDVTWFLLEKR